MNLDLKPMTVEEAHKFVSETLLKATYYCEITEEAAIARIAFFWDCLVQSLIKNYEDWNGLDLKDFKYVESKVIELKSRLVEQKFSQTTIDTQKDKITIDGVQVHPTNVNLDIETEFVYQMGQNAKPHKKHKKLTIEWSEPCESNPVHTVPPPPPPPYHNIGEEEHKQNTVKGFESTEIAKVLDVLDTATKAKGLGEADEFYRNLARIFCGYQPIAKEDQQTATPPK